MSDVFPFTGSTYLGPDPRFAKWRTEQPVTQVDLTGGGRAWLVTRYEDVRSVLADPRFSRAEACRPDAPKIGGALPTPPEMIIAMDAPEHTRLRRLVTKAFTSRRVEELRPWVSQLVDQLIDDIEAKGAPADLISTYTTPLPLTVICELLGVPEKDRHNFQDWARKFATVNGPPEEALEGIRLLGEYIVGLIAAKRESSSLEGDDLLSALIAARDDDDRLSEEELVVFGYTLLGAGFDTTASQLANSTLCLITRYREEWDRLHQHPEHIPLAVEELLRGVNLFATDTTGFPRIALEDVSVGDVVIHKGETVFLVLSSANRDEAVFKEPDKLDLSRVDNRHIAFGHGIHRCLGAELARLELQVGLAALIRRFPNLRLAVPESELHWHSGEVNHTLLEFPVEW